MCSVAYYQHQPERPVPEVVLPSDLLSRAGVLPPPPMAQPDEERVRTEQSATSSTGHDEESMPGLDDGENSMLHSLAADESSTASLSFAEPSLAGQANLVVVDGLEGVSISGGTGNRVLFDGDSASQELPSVAVFDQLDEHPLSQEGFDPYWCGNEEADWDDYVQEEEEEEVEEEEAEEEDDTDDEADPLHSTPSATAARCSNRPPPEDPLPNRNHHSTQAEAANHPDLGVVRAYAADDPSHLYLYPTQERGLMRFYDLCDSAGTSRGFMDAALKMIGNAVDVEKFKPSLAKSRKSFVDAKKKQYKMKEPVCVDVPLANVFGDPLATAHPDQFRRGKRDVASVVKFDFVGMVIDLLEDRGIFGNLDNLVVRRDDPFYPYANTTGNLDEILDGSWYEDTVIEMIEEEGMDIHTEFFLPIVIYLDKTGIDNNQRYALEPVLFTFAFIRRHIRRTNRANRILGFVPDLELKSSAVKEVQRSRVASNSAAAANYHACLDVLVRQIAEAEEKGVHTYLRLGNEVKLVRLRFKIAFVVGDGKSGDTLCLRKGSHKSAKRLSRSCDVPQRLADRTNHQCNFLTETLVNDLVQRARATQIGPGQTRKELAADIKLAKEKLHEIASHTVINAFHGADFGCNKAGILGATPVDPMHCFLIGLLKYIMKLAVGNLPPSKKAMLDAIIDKIFVGLRTSEKGNFPRSCFSKGFTNLTQITADEWTGMLMTLLLSVRISKEAADIMRTVFTNKTDLVVPEQEPPRTVNANQEQEEPDDTEEEEEEEVMDNPCSLDDFIFLAEALLCFHAWYKLGSPFPWVDKVEAQAKVQASIRQLLAMILAYMPRRTGNGWKIQKFHDLLHLSKDMAMFGSPLNFDAGPYESSLRFWAKRMGKTTQKRGYKIFAKQVGDRIFEYHCMGKARRDMGLMGDDDGLPALTQPASHLGPISLPEPKPVFEIVTDPTTRVVTCNWLAGNSKKRKGSVDIHPSIIGYFTDSKKDPEQPMAPRYGYTRLKAGDVLYRAHPNFHNEGPWYDWSYVAFDRDFDDYPFDVDSSDDSATRPMHSPEYIPVKILCFLGDGTGDGETALALVHCCEWRENSFDDTVITEMWDLEYTLPGKDKRHRKYRKAVIRCVHASALTSSVFVVEESPGVKEGFLTTADPPVSTRVLVVKPRTQWAKAFT